MNIKVVKRSQIVSMNAQEPPKPVSSPEVMLIRLRQNLLAEARQSNKEQRDRDLAVFYGNQCQKSV